MTAARTRRFGVSAGCAQRALLVCLAWSGAAGSLSAQKPAAGPVFTVDAGATGVFDTNILRNLYPSSAYSGSGEMLVRLSNRMSRPTLQLEYAAAFRGSSIEDPNAGVGQRVSALAAAQLVPFARLNLIGRGGRGGVDEDLSSVDELMLLGRFDLEPLRLLRLRAYGAHRWRDQADLPDAAIGQYAGGELRLSFAATTLLLDGRYEIFEPTDSTRDWYRRAASVSAAQRVSARSALEADARYRVRDYPRRLVQHNDARVPRQDSDWRFGLSWIFDTRVGTEVRLGYEYEDRASNDARREYDAHRVMLHFRQRILGFGGRRDPPPIDERAATPVIHRLGAREPAPPQIGFADLTVGGAAFCARTDADLAWCWPERVDEAITVPGAWTVVAAGPKSACALDADGAAHCWNLTAAVGPLRPVRVRTDVRFSALAVGGDHVCGLTVQGAAFCWGNNRYGQLGTGTTRDAPTPVPAAAQIRFRSLGAGARHTCGLDIEDMAWCWGANESGQAATPTMQPTVLNPKRIEGFRFTAISVGMSHNCGLIADGALCWGNGSRGQLGHGTPDFSSKPVRVAHSGSFTAIGAGWAHTCALAASGRAYCWGQNRYGQLGLGAVDDQAHTTPRAVAAERSFTTLAVSMRTCALDADRRIHCWGAGVNGRGTATPASLPAQPAPRR